ncbi:omega-amidase, chloroplastic-like isoform X1 [Rhododendron vialii]|uniref:omega-amidase, chloroplastic-like isoform X1 n=1 Tax=Rhododendron vialii TaxID=182163 RepID=UPI0026602126|nr:omega-amidase, chloroplastic-like isoform X1 [Rhododendron vialii]
MASRLSSSTVDTQISASSEPFEIPKITKFKIGLCQLTVTSNKNDNVAHARNLIEAAAKLGPSLVMLPEMWNCPYSTDYFEEFAEDFDDKDGSPSFAMLSEVALGNGITIVGGSMPERRKNQLHNTCCVFGPDGNLKAKHSKMHLFDINLPGDISFKESDTFTAGDQPTIVDTDVGRIGIGICHDLRFPELATLYQARGAHLICYPGAFNMSTGELLWELEQRARAADNQLYVATCSPSRESVGSYMIWGHSTVVGPSSKIVATSGHEETIVIAEVDYSKTRQLREALPLEKQRRGDVYRLVDVHQQKP